MHDTRDLTTRLAELLHREHAALADFLIALADFDRERRWLELGHTSLFYFLYRELERRTFTIPIPWALDRPVPVASAACQGSGGAGWSGRI